MASNKLIPVLAAAGLLVVGGIVWTQMRPSDKVADSTMKQVPTPQSLPATTDADADTSTETLSTVVTSNNKLRDQVAQIMKQNEELIARNAKLQAESARAAAAAPPAPAPAAAVASEDTASAAADERAQGAASAQAQSPGAIGQAVQQVTQVADQFTQGMPSSQGASARLRNLAAQAAPAEGDYGDGGAAPGAVHYTVMPPMGYAVQTEKPRGNAQGAVPMTRYVRTTEGAASMGATGVGGPATRAARKAAARPKPIPFFTIPENATLAGATGMTALIGRVPIDGRVTDPMQWKAVLGRDNLAANGFEMPPDVAGMIVSGIAIGDMALSCVEGRVRSATFIFNDGTIKTVSSRRGGNNAVNTQNGSSRDDDLGYVTDPYGNPCIPGKFVTNAPAYLTDVVGLGVLGVAGQAYAEAERTVYSDAQGSASTVTGNVGHYALGQAVAGGTNEVSKWLLSRLKNSFDAVIIPSGKPMVINLNKQIDLDKDPDARRLVSRWQSGSLLATGAHYGLE